MKPDRQQHDSYRNAFIGLLGALGWLFFLLFLSLYA